MHSVANERSADDILMHNAVQSCYTCTMEDSLEILNAKSRAVES